jgi:hypothetical protein
VCWCAINELFPIKKTTEAINNMKRIVIVILGMLLTLKSYPQENLLQIERKISEFSVDTTLYSQIDFCYSNTSDNTYVLWIERDNIDSLSNFKRIKKRFHNTKGDMSLIQMIWDGNVGSYTPGLFETFMKIVKPGEKFIVSIIKKGKISTSTNFINSIGKQVVFVNADEIRGLQIVSNIEKFNFSANSVTILAEWLKENK